MRASVLNRPWVRKAGPLWEILFVIVGYLIYSQVRGLAAGRVVDALDNGHRIVSIERSLGIFEELSIQAHVLQNETLVDIFNLIYFYGLFPLLLPTALLLYLKRRDVYYLARNAFLISGGIAVIFFMLLPTAPPRLLGIGFIDTLNRTFTPTYESIPGVNHYAALPSMHVGWNFLTAIAIFLALRGFRLRFLILLLPPVMLFSTVTTGNHYILDGALGIVVAGVGLVTALWFQKRTRQRVLLESEASPDVAGQAPSSS